jgi:hypothetical protein
MDMLMYRELGREKKGDDERFDGQSARIEEVAAYLNLEGQSHRHLGLWF